jgi:tetratricopeptide (TPR) repeat protein
MKKCFAMFVVVLVMLGVWAPLSLTQVPLSGTVKGTVRGADGKPLVDAIVVWVNQENGQEYQLKTDKNGDYFHLGLSPGPYNVTLYKNADRLKAGKELTHATNFQVQLGGNATAGSGTEKNELPFDLKKAEDQAKRLGLTREQRKQIQEIIEKQEKSNGTIKVLNEKIVAANTAAKSGDYDGAISILTEATQMDATRDILWAELAYAYHGSATKQTDPAEKSKRLQDAITDYDKAIDIKMKALETAATKNPDGNKRLAAYYNNLGEAKGEAGKFEDALKSYTQAAQLNPDRAASYYYNAGVMLTNAGKVDEAIAALDKCIAADPTKADAYYQKGVNMIGDATLQGDKTVAPAGTADAFNKYLELAPTGPFADAAKQKLASIGAPVQSSLGK